MHSVNTTGPGCSLSRTAATPSVPWLVGLFLGFFFLAQTPVGQAVEQTPADSQQAAGFTGDGVDACLLCHNVARMRVISETPHGKKDEPHTPFAKHGCESCHGPGNLHVTRLRRGKDRAPMIDYGDNKAGISTPATKQTETCLNGCHAQDMDKLKGMEWKDSTHAIGVIETQDGNKRHVSCSACHQMHVTHDPVKDKEAQAEACYACHEKTKTEHPRFEDKAIVFDKHSCWTCHDVHQLIPEEKTLAAKNVNAEAE